MDPITAWLPLYRGLILEAAAAHELEPDLLVALVWQESNGGLDPRTGLYTPRQLYRFEIDFWVRYLALKPEWDPPSLPLLARDAHIRRVSASYGLCQIMYPTAVDHGLARSVEPEALFEPRLNLMLGAKILADFRRREPDWRSTFLRWNGGGRLAYADEIEAKLQHVIASGVVSRA